MTDRNALGSSLGDPHDTSRRTLYFAALLAREAALSAGIIVVGGSAIEIYTRGAYVSGDIDVIAPTEPLGRVLRGWGFSRTGRLWWSEELRIAVDIVRSEGYSGSEDRIRTIETPYGPVRVAAVEDLVIGRLASTKHWKLPEDLEQAVMLVVAYGGSIDWEYVEFRARKEDVTDLLPELRERAALVRGTPTTSNESHRR